MDIRLGKPKNRTSIQNCSANLARAVNDSRVDSLFEEKAQCKPTKENFQAPCSKLWVVKGVQNLCQKRSDENSTANYSERCNESAA